MNTQIQRTLAGEDWRKIRGYGARYSVSSLGSVRNDERNHILSLRLRGNGYHAVTLYHGGVRTSCYVHKLVAEAFLQPREGAPYVDHMNRIKTDNRVENLRYVTMRENNRNRTSRRGSSSRYLGVCWENSSQKWKAQIKNERGCVCLGRYDIEEDAAMAYDRAAMRLYPEHCNTNFPREHYVRGE